MFGKLELMLKILIDVISIIYVRTSITHNTRSGVNDKILKHNNAYKTHSKPAAQ